MMEFAEIHTNGSVWVNPKRPYYEYDEELGDWVVKFLPTPEDPWERAGWTWVLS